MADNDPIVEKPTYMAHIRYFFDPIDIDHMKAARGIELGTYAGVRKNALAIRGHTNAGDMPPEPERKWSPQRRQTFLNWIMTNYPQGTAMLQARSAALAVPARVRKNVNSLGPSEIEMLRTAFNGVMARDASDPNGYFAIAGIHGLPLASCLHRLDQYNPWHRVYLKTFEDALRLVAGCESVTIPYWDISTPLPQLLQEPPFASYTLPQDPGAAADPPQPGTFFPYATQRYDPATIERNVQELGVLEDIATSATQTMWGVYKVGGYQKFSIQAHDGGHVSIGPTMANQEVASFDPVFWFFHCNLDRLWLQWQQKVDATTLKGFRSTITGDTTWLDGPPLNGLPPFETTADQSIEGDVAYEEDPAVTHAAATASENTAGSIEASRGFTIRRSSPVSVRVKDIDRLGIPGSFVVHLLADGQPIAKRAFFQPNAPRNCANCKKQGLINIDFRIDQEKLLDRKLSVAIEVPSQKETGARFPLSAAGNPTINVRLLLDEQ